MPTANVLDPVDHLVDIGQMLVRLGESPDAVPELRAALERGDHQGFNDVLGRFGIAPPGDLCNPYVTIVILVTTVRSVRECRWVRKPVEPPSDDRDVREEPDLLELLQSGQPVDLLAWLQKVGYMECRWRLQHDYEFVEIEKFVQGMCPPGTF